VLFTDEERSSRWEAARLIVGQKLCPGDLTEMRAGLGARFPVPGTPEHGSGEICRTRDWMYECFVTFSLSSQVGNATFAAD
jgi:hypothetical protein